MLQQQTCLMGLLKELDGDVCSIPYMWMHAYGCRFALQHGSMRTWQLQLDSALRKKSATECSSASALRLLRQATCNSGIESLPVHRQVYTHRRITGGYIKWMLTCEVSPSSWRLMRCRKTSLAVNSHKPRHSDT